MKKRRSTRANPQLVRLCIALLMLGMLMVPVSNSWGGTKADMPDTETDTSTEDNKDKCNDDDPDSQDGEQADNGGGQKVNPAGDPVAFPTGAYFERHVDLDLSRHGMPFKVRRLHSSQHNLHLVPGHGQQWENSLRTRIDEQGDGSLWVHDAYALPVFLALRGTSYQKSKTYEVKKVGGRFEMHYFNGAKAYFDDNGSILSRVHRNGVSHHYKYQGTYDYQVTEVTSKENGANEQTLVEVMWDGQAITKVTAPNDPATPDDDRQVVYEYDSNDRLTKAAGGCVSCSSAGSIGRAYTYVSDGTGGYNIREIKDLSGNVQMTMAYDGSDRVVTQYKGDISAPYQTYSYDGWADGKYVYTDYCGRKETQYLDEENRLVAVTVVDAADPTKIHSRFELDYDPNDNVTRQRWAMSITSAQTKWRTETLEYDSQNRPTLMVRYDYDQTNPVTIEQRTYGDFGNTTWQKTAQGTVQTLAYNSAGLMTQQVVSTADPSETQRSESWVYDDAGLVLTHVAVTGLTTAYSYDASGNLSTKTVDPAGKALTTVYQRDRNGRVTRQTDPRGRVRQTWYGLGGRAIMRRDPLGYTTEYAYNDAGKLSRSIGYLHGAAGVTRETVNVYDDFNRLSLRKELVADDGTTKTYAETAYWYDLNNRVVSTQNPDGVKSGSVYDTAGRLAADLVHDGTNWVTKASYEYDADGNMVAQYNAGGELVLATPTYDGYGRLVESTQPNGTRTVFYHDAAGNVTRRITWSGTTALAEIRNSYSGFGELTRTRQLASPNGSTSNSDPIQDTEFDAYGRAKKDITWVGDSSTAETIFTYDAFSQIVTRQQTGAATVVSVYDSQNDAVSRIVDPAGENIVSTFTYDAQGRLVTSVQPDGTYSVTVFDDYGRTDQSLQYDADDNVIAASGSVYDDYTGRATKSYQLHDPDQSLSYAAASDPATKYYYSTGGRMLSNLDAEDRVTAFFYDAQGRQVSMSAPGGYVTQTVYDASDRGVTRISADGSFSESVYDSYGRVSRSVYYEVAGATTKQYISEVRYDALDRVTKNIDAGADGTFGNTEDRTRISVYDSLGRVTRVTDAKGIHSDMAHNRVGQVTRSIEASGGDDARFTDLVYDVAGRLVTQIAYSANSGGQPDATSAQATEYKFDNLGRVMTVIYPDVETGETVNDHSVRFFYNDMGRVVSRIDQQGVTVVMAYDAAGRLVSKGTTSGDQDVYSYDDLGRLTAAYVINGATTKSAVQRSYSLGGNLTSESQKIGSADARSVTYNYDAASGQLSQLQYPTVTNPFDYGYDSAGRLDTIKMGLTAFADYDYFGGRVTKRTMPNDLVTNYTHDGLGRLITISSTKGSPAVEVDAYAYTLDKMDNRLSRDNLVQDNLQDEQYTYDNLHRLTKTQRRDGGGTMSDFQSWSLDKVGNWGSFVNGGTTQTRQHNDANEITSISNATNPEFDKAGNCLVAPTYDASGSLTMAYDHNNRLTRVQSGTILDVSYAYDALGRRVLKSDAVDSTNSRRYYYNGWQRIFAFDCSATPAQKGMYIWGGQYIDELIYAAIPVSGGTSVACQPLQDGNWNVTTLVQWGGNVLGHYRYDPYGAATPLDADWGTTWGLTTNDQAVMSANPVRYCGYLWNEDTGLYHVRNREYHATMGRWLQRDPLGYVDGMSLYTYVQENPLSYIDFSGAGKWKIDATSGTATAQSGATLSGLAAELTGNGKDWKKLGISPDIQIGQKVDITPLLSDRTTASQNPNGSKGKSSSNTGKGAGRSRSQAEKICAAQGEGWELVSGPTDESATRVLVGDPVKESGKAWVVNEDEGWVAIAEAVQANEGEALDEAWSFGTTVSVGRNDASTYSYNKTRSQSTTGQLGVEVPVKLVKISGSVSHTRGSSTSTGSSHTTGTSTGKSASVTRSVTAKHDGMEKHELIGIPVGLKSKITWRTKIYSIHRRTVKDANGKWQTTRWEERYGGTYSGYRRFGRIVCRRCVTDDSE